MSDEKPWFAHAVNVRFQDVDAAGIVFFARVFDLFHDAYVEALRAHGIELATVLEERVWAAPLRSCDAQFRRPMRFGEQLVVEVRASFVDRDMVLQYRVVSAADESIVHATGTTTHAFVDRATFKRVDPPAAVRAAVESSVR